MWSLDWGHHRPGLLAGREPWHLRMEVAYSPQPTWYRHFEAQTDKTCFENFSRSKIRDLKLCRTSFIFEQPLWTPYAPLKTDFESVVSPNGSPHRSQACTGSPRTNRVGKDTLYFFLASSSSLWYITRPSPKNNTKYRKLTPTKRVPENDSPSNTN